MKAPDKIPPYSYLVRWSDKDREFVASFLELPELCGLAPSISAAIQEAKTALHAWLKVAQRESFEIPEPSMETPCMILDATFAGQEPVLTRIFQKISRVPARPKLHVGNCQIDTVTSSRTKNLKCPKFSSPLLQ